MKKNILWGLVIFCSGCAQTRLYPVCFYDQPQKKETFEKEYSGKLKAALQTAVSSSKIVEVVDTPDARWLVANTTEKENQILAKVWPRIGCIGLSDSRVSVKREMDCVAYINSFIENENYLQLGMHVAAGGVAFPNEASDPNLLVYCNSATISKNVK